MRERLLPVWLRGIVSSALAAASLVSATAAADDATLIVPGERIAGVRLGMTAAEVRDLEGAPSFSNAPDADTQTMIYFAQASAAPLLTVHVAAGRVDRVVTAVSLYATAEGLHVGSPTDDVETAFGEPDSKENVSTDWMAPHYRACYAKRGIAFTTHDFVVTTIAVAAGC